MAGSLGVLSDQPIVERSAGRRLWLDLALLGVIGLGLQAAWTAAIQAPTYMDAYYYAINGRQLAEGHGFSEPIIWQYLDAPAGLPAPSHTYWMPLASILAAAGYRLGGYATDGLLFWLLAGLLPLLAYAISQRLSGERWQAWAAALFAAAGGYYAAFLGQTATFAPFAWAGGVALLLLGLGWCAADKGKTVAAGRVRALWLLAGVCAGLAHLTRADGVLLMLIGLGLGALAAVRARRAGAGSGRELAWALALLLAGYLLVMGGWLWRNWQLFGRPLPAAGAQSLFLTSYDDLFAYGRRFTLATYLDWGLANILRSKAEALWLGLQMAVAIPGLIFLTPFIVLGWWTAWRRPDGRLLLAPFSAYALGLFALATLLFTFPGLRGTLFHSSVALWPWTTALAPIGIGRAVDFAAARLPHWRPARAKRNFSALFALLAVALTLAVSGEKRLAGEAPADYERIGRSLPAGAVVLVGNAPALNYHTGLAALSLPNEPISGVLAVADRYGVSHLALNPNRPAPLADLYAGRASHSRLRLIVAFDLIQLYAIEPPAAGSRPEGGG